MPGFSLISVAHAGIITDAPSVSSVLLKVLAWLLEIFGIIALVAFLGAGAMYMWAGGNDKIIEQAKKWMVYALFGAVVIWGALMIVSTLNSLFLK